MIAPNPALDTILCAYNNYRATVALKVATACCVCLLFIINFQIDNGFMALLVINMIPALFPHAINTMTLERLYGAAAGTAAGLLLIQFENPVVITAWTAAGLIFFVTLHTSMIFLHAGFVAWLTLTAIVQKAFGNPESGLTFGIHWTLLIGLGVVASWLTHSLIRPRSPALALKQQSQAILAKLYRIPKRHQQLFYPLFRSLRKAAHPHLTDREQNYYSRIDNTLQSATEELQTLRKSIDGLSPLLAPAYLDGLKQFFQNCNQTLHHLSPTSIHSHDRINTLTEDYKRLQNLFTHEWKTDINRLNKTSSLPLIARAQRSCLALLNICQYIHEQDPLEPPPPIRQNITKSSINRAMKITFIIMLTMQLSLTLHWQGGFQALVAAMITAAQPNTGLLIHRVFLWLCGLLAGGAAAIAMSLILSTIPSPTLLIALYFSGIYIATYYGLGGERVSFAGLHGGIVLTMVLFYQNPSPAFDLMILTDRLIGLFQGFAIAVLTLMILPDHPHKQFYKAANTLMLHIKERITAPSKTSQKTTLDHEIPVLQQLAADTDRTRRLSGTLPHFQPMTSILTKLYRNVLNVHHHMHHLQDSTHNCAPTIARICIHISRYIPTDFRQLPQKNSVPGLSAIQQHIDTILQDYQTFQLHETVPSETLSHSVCALLACRDASQNLITLHRRYNQQT